MIIQFGDLKTDQANLQGKLGIDIFNIENDGDICSIGPVSCDLDTEVNGDLLIVNGRLSVPFQLRCVGCLEEFSYLEELDDYHAEIEIEDPAHVDLTGYIRDDLLLALPPYPRCSQGTDGTRICPMKGPFSCESGGGGTSPEGSGESRQQGAWDALENLDTGDH